MPYYKNGVKTYTKAEKAEYAKRMAAKRKKAAPKKKSATRTRKTRASSGSTGHAIGSMIGTAIGGVPGGLVGGGIGKIAHQIFSALTGFGDYQVKGNTLMLGGMSPPQVVNSVDKGGVIIRHREYLGDIKATIDFTNTEYDINPGLVNSFPWLSAVAGSFEEYRMRGLVYEFKSLSSDAVLSSATSSALGSVIMATSYNVLNPKFANKMQMENYEFANSSKPSCSFLHPVECKRSWTPVSELFVREGVVPPGSDQRLYDLGKFQIATVGMQASSGICGELWCTYEIELYKPKFDTDESVLADNFVLINVDNGKPLGTLGSSYLSVGSNLRGSLSNGVGVPSENLNRYNFPTIVQNGDKFLVQYLAIGNTDATIDAPSVATVGCEILPWYGAGAYSIVSAPADGFLSERLEQSFVVTITDRNEAHFSFNGSTEGLPADIIAANLMVSKLPDDMKYGLA